jgi:ferric-dicitrate binding protein FerR (iron transport regulator)
LLVAGREGQLTDSTALIIANRSAEETEAWIHGRIVFDETPVPEMLRTLQRWYGYEFRLTDSTLAHQQVTGVFPIGDTVRTLNGLKTLLNVTMRFDGAIVTLSPLPWTKKPNTPIRRRRPISPLQLEVGK